MDPQNNQNQQQNSNAQNNSAPQNGMPNLGPNHNMVMGVFAYLGPLVLIPYLASKKDDFVMFHAKQGLVVFGIEVLVWIFSSFMWQLYMILGIINLGTFILSIIGIINVVQGNKKELPLVGSLAKSFNL